MQTLDGFTIDFFSISFIRSLAASIPIILGFWLITVSCGSKKSVISQNPYPKIPISSGILSPASLAALNTPRATLSFTVKIISGRFPELLSFLKELYPSFNSNPISNIQSLFTGILFIERASINPSNLCFPIFVD